MKKKAFLISILWLIANVACAGWHELLQNNGFESTPMIWTYYYLTGGDPESAGIVDLANAHTGSWYAYVGDVDTSHHNALGVVRQVVTLPANTTLTILSLYVNVTSLETTTTQEYDTMGAYLRTYPADAQVIAYHQWSNLDKDPNGVKNNYLSYAYTADASSYAGQQMTLQFYGQTDPSLSTTFRIDDVSLQAYVPDYTISVSAGANGNVTPAGNVSVETGQTLNLSAAPALNYTVDQWSVNGSAVQSGGTSFSLVVSANADVSVTFKPIVYSVSVAAGANGNVNPSGSINVNAGDNLALTATPNANYVVDQWTVNGVTAQTGGTAFSLDSVSGNASVLVTFKIVTHTLTIVAANGSVSASPQLSAYPHGGEVTLTATPAPSYWLYDWRGDLSGVGNSLRFNIMSDTTVEAFFQQIPSPFNVTVTPPSQTGSFQINIPPIAEMVHILQCSLDLCYWQNLQVFDGNQPNIANINPSANSQSVLVYRTQLYPKITTPAFLSFPVINPVTGTTYTSTTTPISTIFDHHGSHTVPTPYAYTHDGAIMTYKSQLFDINHTAAKGLSAATGNEAVVDNNPGDPNYFGSTQPNGQFAFTQIALQMPSSVLSGVVFNYQDSDSYLYYDGHSGYDYVVGGNGSGDQVVAAAAGYIVPEDFDCFNIVSIDHGNGYKTCYLHMRMSDISDAIKLNGALVRTYVTAGQFLGLPGDVGGCNGQTVPVHLHFEVRRNTGTDANGNTIWTWVDPYGFFAANGDMIDPVLWLPGQ